MPYDSMAAWARTFEFNDAIQSRYASKHISIPTVMLTADSGRQWSGRISYDSTRGKQISRDDYSPPTPPASAHKAPSFIEAKSHWSPPSSPQTRSLQGSPPASPVRTSSPVALDSPPLSPQDQSALADKLYAAACAGDLRHIRLLLSLGAPINAPTMVDGLYDAFKPAKPGCLSALAGAAGHGQLGAVKLLLANGAALNPPMRQSSSSPLHQACKSDDVEMASYLLEADADVDLMNCFNTTPLMYAGKYGTAPLVSLILSYGPDLHRLSFINTAAIHWSLWPGNEDVMELLLQAGADPNHPMGDGSTPLHCAALSELPGIARVLLMYGANPLKRNEEWKTPLQVAVEMEHWKTAAVLQEAEKPRTA